MRLIRKGIFETNSSSTHALVAPHHVDDEEYSLSDSLFKNYCFGRKESRLVDDWDEKLAYLYIIIKEINGYEWEKEQIEITKKMIASFKERVNDIYKKVYDMVEYKPPKCDPIPNDIFDYIDGKKTLERNVISFDEDEYSMEPFVDHVGEFATKKEFFDKLFNDDEFLKRFIFNKESYITIGGDEYRGYNIKKIGFQYDYDDKFVDDGEFWKKLEEYKKENDVFLKGN